MTERLFPLETIICGATGYFMDAGGVVWSDRSRKGRLIELAGSKSTSWRYYTLQRDSGSAITIRSDKLTRLAIQHPDWNKHMTLMEQADASPWAKRQSAPPAPTLANDFKVLETVVPDSDMRRRLQSLIDQKVQRENAMKAAVSSDRRNHAESAQAGITARGWIIAAVSDGQLIFGTKPAIHTTITSVNSELKRLATAQAGRKFVKLRIEGALTIGETWE